MYLMAILVYFVTHKGEVDAGFVICDVVIPSCRASYRTSTEGIVLLKCLVTKKKSQEGGEVQSITPPPPCTVVGSETL